MLHYSILSFLLFFVDHSGETPLHTASRNGHLSVVKYLISRGADVNKADNSGYTPLHTASMDGHLPVVEYLMSHGDLNPADNDGWTPLLIGSMDGHLLIVNYFIQHRAFVNTTVGYELEFIRG